MAMDTTETDRPLVKPKVIIHVRNCVATCFFASPGIEVEIIDLDDLDEDELRALDDDVR